jgi:hypothetical protein
MTTFCTRPTGCRGRRPGQEADWSRAGRRYWYISAYPGAPSSSSASVRPEAGLEPGAPRGGAASTFETFHHRAACSLDA